MDGQEAENSAFSGELRHRVDLIIEGAMNGALALVAATRRSDGKTVAVLCAGYPDANDGAERMGVVPLAIMLEGKDADDLTPPDGIEVGTALIIDGLAHDMEGVESASLDAIIMHIDGDKIGGGDNGTS